MSKKKNILCFIALIIITLLFSGCKYDKVENKENKDVSIEKQDKETLEVLDRSEDISDLVVDLIGIENATSIVFQDSALIVVTFYEENDTGLTKDLSESIERLVLENDDNINKVLISEDENVFDEIEEIIQGLMRGEDIKSYTSQLNKIFQKTNAK
ncbi:MAG TPA: YhcN/YlaJ family sporulation lipoprotein [Tissierellales bacterium]|nr:YhcN/YlaJ family sporulation lipoprotein [Tissierellales bacterium]